MKVIGVTGLPGSGKGVVSRVAKKLGIPIISMGDVIRNEAKKRDEKTGDTAVKLRKEYGEFIVAERCVKTIKEYYNTMETSNNIVVKSPIFMIEGIRSPYEVEIFKKNFNYFKVIAVHSTPRTRFKRLQRRKRPDDSREKSEFTLRDERELKFGIGNVIATADYMIINKGPIKKIKSIVRSILENEMQNDRKNMCKPYRRS
ncbi:MAG: nucleoside monophosphate kinase [Methanobacterium sp.]|nr:nucleoside monophosphate kinase [Methanobacterium sp.]